MHTQRAKQAKKNKNKNKRYMFAHKAAACKHRKQRQGYAPALQIPIHAWESESRTTKQVCTCTHANTHGIPTIPRCVVGACGNRPAHVHT